MYFLGSAFSIFVNFINRKTDYTEVYIKICLWWLGVGVCKAITQAQAGFSPARPRDILAGISRSHKKSLWIYSIFYYKRKFRSAINLKLS